MALNLVLRTAAAVSVLHTRACDNVVVCLRDLWRGVGVHRLLCDIDSNTTIDSITITVATARAQHACSRQQEPFTSRQYGPCDDRKLLGRPAKFISSHPYSATIEHITPCLWFDDQAEGAASYYVDVFERARSML